VAATSGVAIDARAPRTADPARLGRAEDGIDRCALGWGREGPDDVQVHVPSVATAVRLRRHRVGRRRPAPRGGPAGGALRAL